MKWKIAVCLEFANNFGNLAEDSSHNFWDVDSSKIVEGMNNFLGDTKKINSEMRGKRECILFRKREYFNWRVKNWREWSGDQFLKKTLFGLWNYRVKLQYFYQINFSIPLQINRNVKIDLIFFNRNINFLL